MPQAVDFYKKSLKLNPFLWWSFESICNTGKVHSILIMFVNASCVGKIRIKRFILCDSGERVDPSKYFTLSSAINAYKSQIIEPAINSNQNSVTIALQSQLLQQQENKNVIFNANQSNVKSLDQQQQQQQQQSSMQPPVSDSFEQKGKQEIVNLLKEVEADQLNKINNNLGQKSQPISSSGQIQPHYHHHASCVYYQNYIASLNPNSAFAVSF
jgi:hypothetical protein